jgi:hypothetical protein
MSISIHQSKSSSIIDRQTNVASLRTTVLHSLFRVLRFGSVARATKRQTQSKATFLLYSFIMVVSLAAVLLGSLSCLPATTWGFAPSLNSLRSIPHKNNNWRVTTFPSPSNIAETPTTLFANKLWDRMEIEEDEEPMWYVVNCVAGLEIDLLRQCRQRCEEMEDVEKFVVPMITSTRSHGANRMVKDVKVRYQGYVFAKLRLSAQTYAAVQGE